MQLDPYRRDPAPKQEHIDAVKKVYPYARHEYSDKGQYWFIYHPYTVPSEVSYQGPSAKSPAQAWEFAAEELEKERGR